MSSGFPPARSMIGLVPQELTTDQFETVWNTVSFSRGLLRQEAQSGAYREGAEGPVALGQEGQHAAQLSGGMKRRVLIAKALSHEPKILFLDEPTAGVDVNAAPRDVAGGREAARTGVTIILTTHYIEEAEEIADRVGVINGGKLLLMEEKGADAQARPQAADPRLCGAAERAGRRSRPTT
jgi:ABC-2 type transport system ATP-binding protein